MAQSAYGRLVVRVDPEHLSEEHHSLAIVARHLGHPKPRAFIVGVVPQHLPQNAVGSPVVMRFSVSDGPRESVIHLTSASWESQRNDCPV
jgi:hypothetical protein